MKKLRSRKFRGIEADEKAAKAGQNLKALQEAVKMLARLAREAEKRNPGEGGAEFIVSMAVKTARAADIRMADVQKMFG